jgi:hypothetical protein
MNQEEIADWYERFKDYEFEPFYSMILKIKNKMMPNAIELEALCEQELVNENFKILDLMWKDGYFKYGSYGELAPEQQSRNFEKAMMWLNTGVIPEWFQKDMEEYRQKMIPANESLAIGDSGGRESLQLPDNQSHR